MEQVNQQISSAHNWLARIAFIFFGIMLMTFFGIVYLANKQYETPTSLAPTPIIYTAPSPTPDTRAGWKIYTNDKHKFSIKYPQYLTLTENSKATYFWDKKSLILYSVSFLLPLPSGTPDIYKPFQGITIRIFDNPQNKSIEHFAENVIASGTKDIIKLVYEPFFVDNLEGKKVLNIPGETITHNIGVKKNSKMYWFILEPLKQNDFETVNSMVSTFKFLDDQTMTAQVSPQEKQQIDAWILKNNLNQYGDPKDTVYTGGTPLFDERTGQSKDKYEYILEKHPTRPWKISQ